MPTDDLDGESTQTVADSMWAICVTGIVADRIVTAKLRQEKIENHCFAEGFDV